MQLQVPFNSTPFHFISFLLTDVPEIGKEIRALAVDSNWHGQIFLFIASTDRCEALNSIPNELDAAHQSEAV